MDPIRNPYSPGAGQTPPFLAGRDDLVNDFTVGVERLKINNPVQHMLLPGLRGVGKTALLNRFYMIGKHRGGLCEVMECYTDETFGNKLASVLPGMLHGLTKTWTDKESVQRVGSTIRSFISHFEAGVNLGVASLKYAPSVSEANTGVLEFDLTDLLVVLGEETQKNNGFVCLLIDEMQNMDDGSMSALMGAMHKTNQLGLPVLIVGSGLPTIAKTIVGTKPYAERMFRSIPVGALDETGCAEGFTFGLGGSRL